MSFQIIRGTMKKHTKATVIAAVIARAYSAARRR